MNVTVRVLPGWRVYHERRVYESGELVELPLIRAVEWTAWGSVR